MIELLAGLGIGGGVAIASGFVGQIMGFARGSAQRNVTELFTTGQTDALYCVCNNPLSFHKNGRACSGTRVQDDGITPLKNHYGHEVACKCTKFVGDPSKNPPPKTVKSKGALDLG